MGEGKVIELTKENFEEKVINSGELTLVDFWAEWCGPCRGVAPIVEQLAEEYKERLTVGKVNVDNEEELATQFRIMSIPTIALFKDGEVVDRFVGARSIGEFRKTIDKHITEK